MIQKNVRPASVARSTFRGPEIAHTVKTSNFRPHADTLYRILPHVQPRISIVPSRKEKDYVLFYKYVYNKGCIYNIPMSIYRCNVS